MEDLTVDPAVGAAILDRCSSLVPELAGAEVHEHMAGVRPYRKSIRLEADLRDGIRVVHNYGHGGSGVSLSWGCADSVVAIVADLAA